MPQIPYRCAYSSPDTLRKGQAKTQGFL